MFRMWGKLVRSNHLLADHVYRDATGVNGTRKVFRGLEEICRELDLQVPIWLDKNIEDFKRISKTRFGQDNFIEPIGFDWLEIQVIEEDEDLWP
ncbi:MAG: hypothetical protein IIY92_01330 [Lachnospiraceae bacterium]|nr:hypothetical protein [Lachnospiraceae bacterium]